MYWRTLRRKQKQGSLREKKKKREQKKEEKKNKQKKTAIIDVRDKLPACCFAYTEMNEWFRLERS